MLGFALYLQMLVFLILALLFMSRISFITRCILSCKIHICDNGLDYNEMFTPVTHLEMIRLLFALAVEKDWEIRQINIKTTYLYGDLDEEIFMEIPEGLPNPTGEVFQAEKGLVRLEAGRSSMVFEAKVSFVHFWLETGCKRTPHLRGSQGHGQCRMHLNSSYLCGRPLPNWRYRLS